LRTFDCPYLKGEVELTDEREAHIAHAHPDLLPEYLLHIGHTLAAYLTSRLANGEVEWHKN